MSTPKTTTADRLRVGDVVSISFPDIDQPLIVAVAHTGHEGDMVWLGTGGYSSVTLPKTHEVEVLRRMHPNELDYYCRSLEDYYRYGTL